MVQTAREGSRTIPAHRLLTQVTRERTVLFAIAGTLRVVDVDWVASTEAVEAEARLLTSDLPACSPCAPVGLTGQSREMWNVIRTGKSARQDAAAEVRVQGHGVDTCPVDRRATGKAASRTSTSTNRTWQMAGLGS